jgi:hypothetical protein
MRNTVSTVCVNQKFDMALQRMVEETPHINHNKLYCKSVVEFTSYIELKSLQMPSNYTLRENLNNTCILYEMNTLFQFPQDQDVDSLVNEFTN